MIVPASAMDQTSRQLSYALDEVVKAIAEWTVSRHHERDASLSERYGTGWRRAWVGHVLIEVRYLSQALAVQSPELFAESIAWWRDGFQARSDGEEDLVTSLRCMREVIEEKTPHPIASPAVEYIDRAVARIEGPDSPPSRMSDAGQPLEQPAQKYLEALLDGRETDARQIVDEAVRDGYAVADACERILQPAQRELGRMWHRGEISVADEHFATATTEEVLTLLRSRNAPPSDKGPRLLAAAVGGELHALGLRIVADYFAREGWRVYFLGANMPAGDVIDAIEQRKPDLVALSATSPMHIRDLAELIDAIRRHDPAGQVKIMVGGPPFRAAPDLWKQLGADGSAESAAQAVELGDRLVQT